MKGLKLIIAVSIILTASCKKEAAFESDCIQAIIEGNGLVAYNGQDIGCKTFLMLYCFEGNQYFLSGNNYADMLSYPIDCDGNKLCETYDDMKCKEFFANAEFIKIIGFKK